MHDYSRYDLSLLRVGLLVHVAQGLIHVGVMRVFDTHKVSALLYMVDATEFDVNLFQASLPSLRL